MGRDLGIGIVTKVAIDMSFFTRIIREKLSAFQLRDAFKVELVG